MPVRLEAALTDRFCRLSDLTLLLVAGVSFVGFYYLSTLSESFSIHAGGRNFSRKELLGVWCVLSGLMFIMSSAISTILWIIGISAVIVCIHSVFHDVSRAALSAVH